jgi:polyisoprenoid-binding protein YceI
MRNLATLTALAAVVAAVPAAAQVPTWQIDTAHSAAQFSVKHMMVTTVRGHFGKLSGSVLWDGQDITTAVIEASVDVASIDTREEKRDAHLKSPDFFDAATHPTMTFKSVSVAPAGNGKARLTGDLTIRGVTRRVVFDVDGPTPIVNTGGTLRVGATATAVINRKDFGVSWSRVLDGGGLVVSDEVTLTIDIQATRKAN